MSSIESTFIDQTVLIHIQDGRAFKGTFVCTDGSRNVILANSEEFNMVSTSNTSNPNSILKGNSSISTDQPQLQQRWVGMVMVRGQDIQKIELQSANRNHSNLLHSPNVSTKQASIAPPGWPTDPDMYL